ncbi:hypothetical protein HMPREF0972_01083 [Actinomyces sp. oral taxon 848 str. F0332]|nr:hypothetical protein HMPREF0972_01083 [Actinomyces sp. oral taxon 848 str. F0332]
MCGRLVMRTAPDVDTGNRQIGRVARRPEKGGLPVHHRASSSCPHRCPCPPPSPPPFASAPCASHAASHPPLPPNASPAIDYS